MQTKRRKGRENVCVSSYARVDSTSSLLRGTTSPSISSLKKNGLNLSSAERERKKGRNVRGRERGGGRGEGEGAGEGAGEGDPGGQPAGDEMEWCVSVCMRVSERVRVIDFVHFYLSQSFIFSSHSFFHTPNYFPSHLSFQASLIHIALWSWGKGVPPQRC